MAMCAFWREATIGSLVAAALLAPIHAVRADDLAKAVVIVYNVEDPDSRPLADYYALKRGVPGNQICEIDVRPSETITRAEYNQKIRDPIGDFLVRQGLIHQEPRTIFDSILGKIPGLGTVSTKVSCIVLMYGVPLRIDNDPNCRNWCRTRRKEGISPERRLRRKRAGDIAQAPARPLRGSCGIHFSEAPRETSGRYSTRRCCWWAAWTVLIRRRCGG